MTERYIGLMSGTSLDGVDGAIYDFSGEFPKITAEVTAFSSAPFTAELRAELLELNSAGDNELHRAALADPIKPQTRRYSRCRRTWTNRAPSAWRV